MGVLHPIQVVVKRVCLFEALVHVRWHTAVVDEDKHHSDDLAVNLVLDEGC